MLVLLATTSHLCRPRTCAQTRHCVPGFLPLFVSKLFADCRNTPSDTLDNLYFSAWHGVWLWSSWISHQRSLPSRTQKLPWLYLQTLCVCGYNSYVPLPSPHFHRGPRRGLSWGHLSSDCQELQSFHSWCLQAFDREASTWMGESTCQIGSHILSQSSICCSLMVPTRSQLFLPSSCWDCRFLLQLRIAWQHQGFSSQRCKHAPRFFWYSTYTWFDYLYLRIHMVDI